MTLARTLIALLLAPWVLWAGYTWPLWHILLAALVLGVVSWATVRVTRRTGRG